MEKRDIVVENVIQNHGQISLVEMSEDNNLNWVQTINLKGYVRLWNYNLSVEDGGIISENDRDFPVVV